MLRAEKDGRPIILWGLARGVAWLPLSLSGLTFHQNPNSRLGRNPSHGMPSPYHKEGSEVQYIGGAV